MGQKSQDDGLMTEEWVFQSIGHVVPGQFLLALDLSRSSLVSLIRLVSPAHL